jgi:hypothetical protein
VATNVKVLRTFARLKIGGKLILGRPFKVSEKLPRINLIVYNSLKVLQSWLFDCLGNGLRTYKKGLKPAHTFRGYAKNKLSKSNAL